MATQTTPQQGNTTAGTTTPTSQEQQIISMLAQGYSPDQIAQWMMNNGSMSSGTTSGRGQGLAYSQAYQRALQQVNYIQQNFGNYQQPQYEQGGRPGNVYSNTTTPNSQLGTPNPGTPQDASNNPGFTNPNEKPGGGGGGGGGGYPPIGSGLTADTSANLAEKRYEFNITTARDIAKENAAEVDALQKELASLSGPKDTYADYFFAHGLLPPRGYTPAPVPLTDAQIAAFKNMGVSPQQLQSVISGTGQPGADYGMLGNMGSALQTPSYLPQPIQGMNPQIQQNAPSNPTMQGGALAGKVSPMTPPLPPNATSVATNTGVPATPAVPSSVPSMASGGTVPGAPGQPQLAVLHGGEQVGQGPSGPLLPNSGSVHPAIAKLLDAISELVASPDFQQFTGMAGKATALQGKGKSKSAKGKSSSPDQQPPQEPPSMPGQAPQMPGPAVTPGGVQAMATGGIVGSQLPLGGGQQGMIPTSGLPNWSISNPIMPIQNMDPYTRALYDVHGRLRPYSAQQEQQMGPQGVNAVTSYVGKVEGGDVDAYKNLVDRLRPSGAPVMGDVQGENFTTG